MVTCQVRKWGNSLGIVIPNEVSKQLNLHPEDHIVVQIEKRENPLKELWGALKGTKVTWEEVKQWRKELESKYI